MRVDRRHADHILTKKEQGEECAFGNLCVVVESRSAKGVRCSLRLVSEVVVVLRKWLWGNVTARGE